MQPSEILRARFELEAKLSSTGSLTGIQLEQLSEGRQGGGSPTEGMSRLIVAYMDACKLTKGLSAEETAVCRLRYLKPAGVESYERDEFKHNAAEASRHLGEIPVSSSASPEGMVKMVGVRAKLATFAEIAEDIPGLTPRQAQSRYNDACSKVKAAQKERKVQREQQKTNRRDDRPEADTLAKRLYNRANKCTTCYGKRVMTLLVEGKPVQRTCRCQVL